MSGINWKLFLIAALLTIGLYLVIMYQDSPKLSPTEKSTYHTRRQMGWVIIVGSIVLGGYFYYQGTLTFKVHMPSDCQTCKLYVHRHRGLRPYTVNEIDKLRTHASACNTCSDMCFDEIQLLKRNPPVNQTLLANKKASCADTTKHAILARNELDRLETRLGQKKTSFWQGAQKVGANTSWDPFPKVPGN